MINWILKQKILVSVSLILIISLGLFTFPKMKLELLPVINFSSATIDIYGENLNSVELEKEVTNRVEAELDGIDGILSFSSTTRDNQAQINIEMEEGKGDQIYPKIERLANDTQSTLDNIIVRSRQDSTVYQYDLWIDIYGKDKEELSNFVKQTLEPRFMTLPEVKAMKVTGMVDKEMIISFDHEKLKEHNISLQQLQGTITNYLEGQNIGKIATDSDNITIRWEPAQSSITNLKSILLPTQNGNVTLDEVSNVYIQSSGNPTITSKTGNNNYLMIRVGRHDEYSEIDLTNAVEKEIKALKDEGTINGFELNILTSNANFMNMALNGVQQNILLGGFLSLIILLVFLRNIRATLIAGTSIIFSVLLTISTMYFFGFSFNLLTLIGLGLSIGMMVDSTIVLLESIYKKYQDGLAPIKAVIKGTRDVVSPIIASMSTTLIVFLPTFMLNDEIGTYIKVLAMVMIVSILSSVVIAFLAIPSLANIFIKNVVVKDNIRSKWFHITYTKTMHWILLKKRRIASALIAFIILFGSSIALLPTIPFGLMPDIHHRQAEATILFETGTEFKDKESVQNYIQNELNNVNEIVNYSLVEVAPDLLWLLVNMTPIEESKRTQKEINNEIQGIMDPLVEREYITFVSGVNSNGSSPISLLVTGSDYKEIENISKNVIDSLKKIDGITSVNSDLQRQSNDHEVIYNKSLLNKHNITEQEVNLQLQQSLVNIPIGSWTSSNEEFKIRLKNQEDFKDISSIENLPINVQGGSIQLKNVAQVSRVTSPIEIQHYEGERLIKIFGNVTDRDMGSILDDVETMIDDLDLPNGYTVQLSGKLKDQATTYYELIFVLVLSLFLVYGVMALQFNSLAKPILVMSIIPFTLIGVIIGLAVTGNELNALSSIGVIILIGIVVNNAILLIDQFIQIRKEGNMSLKDSVALSGSQRLRPILMTTFTTIGGMLPLVFDSGIGSNFQSPLATVISFGLLFSTLITLIIIPILLYIVEHLTKKLKRNKLTMNKTRENNYL
ncbi:efflux RND transporter permease subunit [Cytobacillus sp. IB215665]|uniref:efflux RND transporter permease subunit n=1 Tax=Cytobacillus sp. IB215665 TaxID=3097357 RepID=UPI002A11153C|nr:efflux RND transporter permease subunit [Cytobacillus sp. IB215665]MDX8365551.1 efflux RND transporter permease subunit [Cytobacillus sp. IB215665]